MPDHRRILPVLACALLLACGDPLQRDDFIEHPIGAALTIDPADALVIRRGTAAPAAVEAFIHQLRGRSVSSTIGVLDGAPEFVFGSVADAQVLHDGAVAVLDRQAALVRVYEPDGSHRHSFGGPGEGPGEFDVPVALVVPEVGVLWVIDEARTIHRFRESDRLHEFIDRLTVDSYPRDACATRESIIVHMPAHVPGVTRDDVLYSLRNPDGEVQAGFAVPYRYEHRLAADRMRRGMVACAHDGSVLLAYEAQNRLDAYDPATGDLRWHAAFEGVHIPVVRESELPDGRRSIRPDTDARPVFNTLLSLAGGDGVPAVVQYARRTRADVRNRIDRYVVETFVVDPVTGAGAYAGEDVPEIMTLSADQVVLLYREPFPRIEVARLGRS